jgi:mono/diheme cytochrome c family protein
MKNMLAVAAVAILGFAPIVAISADAPYTVNAEGKVDKVTRQGFETWRAAACERCHGPNQEGMVGPSLVESLKVLTKDQFKTTVLNGRPEKGMPNHPQLEPKIDSLYSYLKCRSDGACKTAKVIAAE